MANTKTRPTGGSRPATGAELSQDWLNTRRLAAFAIDYTLYGLLAFILVVLLTIFTDDLAAVRLTISAGPSPLSDAHASIHHGPAYYAAAALTLAAALAHVANTLGGEPQATFGMRVMALRLQRLDGGLISPRYAIAHTLVFVALIAVFTPLVVLAPLLLTRKQTLHDRLLDTAMVKAD